MHQLLTHNPALDDTFFITKFLEGLKREIRSATILHKPRTVDVVISLALLQEAQMHDDWRPHYEPKKWHNHAGPGKLSPHPLEAQTDVAKATEQAQLQGKLDTLRAQRRARGECFRCGGKYAPGHKYPKQVDLAVIAELCDALQIEAESNNDEDKPEDDASSESSGEQVMSLSSATSQGTTSKRTMWLLGYIGRRQILILIDSGSSGNFISDELVDILQLQVHTLPPVQVTIANGARMLSTEGIHSLKWGVQQTKFETPVRVLPLKCYDLILGMEWLESCNNGKMFVDWRRKKMRFMHEGQRVTLRGINANNVYCPVISNKEVNQLIQQGAIAQLVLLVAQPQDPTPTPIPADIQTVIDQHSAVFQEPKSLPPPRPFDHQIQLVPGAVPVQKKPYRYAPTQKDELEKQISDMLKRGVVQPSHSPYASPVILVKKKDGGWRMCVDYRYLNALTVKNKYPLPVVDELLDELAGAKYFTKLDLRSGYHQIRLVEGEEFKTAFKTHHGRWEFKVMPFRLTNASATFQAAMNVLFANLLRKGVLIFMDDILIYTTTMSEHQRVLEEVFKVWIDNQLYVKQSKCTFAQTKLEYLGHVISEDRVATEP